MSKTEEKRINVITTAYEGDPEFPEAAHYPDYVARSLAETYPGFTVDVGVGLDSRVTVYGAESDDVESIMQRDIMDAVKVYLWEGFCADGWRAYAGE